MTAFTPSARRLMLALCLTGVAALAGCRAGSPVDFKPLSFTQYQPIYLNVTSIEMVEEYKSPMSNPNVEHLLPYSPAEAMRIWVRDRLRAIGNDRTLQVIIKDGSVTVTQLPVGGGFMGFFKSSQDKRYDAKLAVELRIFGGESALAEANVVVNAKHSITLGENASVYERDVAFREMIAEMMEGVNAELEKNIFKYMGNHINFSQNP
jgi:hypothetical protein